MTKSQIKAELRRSAVFDDDPARDCKTPVYWEAKQFLDCRDPSSPYQMADNDCRTFFLLVAEAL